MLAQLVAMAFDVYGLGLIAYAVCSWIPYPQAKKLENWLRPWYEPLLRQIRRVIKPLAYHTTRVDLTPLVLFLGLVLARKMILAILLLPY
jgi:uncharacterized protein YggT (Ycf19 family)